MGCNNGTSYVQACFCLLPPRESLHLKVGLELLQTHPSEPVYGFMFLMRWCFCFADLDLPGSANSVFDLCNTAITWDVCSEFWGDVLTLGFQFAEFGCQQC